MRTTSRTNVMHELDRAVRHERADNKHIRRVLRWAADPATAATATDLLSNHNATLVQAINMEGHLDDYSVLGALFRTDAAAMLKEQDVPKLNFALLAAMAVYVGVAPVNENQNLADVLANTVSDVRAAYVLARDLDEVEFDDDMDDD